MDSDIIKIIALAVVALVVVIFGPFVTIWALNLLFNLTIPVTLGTWFAVLWLGGVVTYRSSK